MHTHNVNVKNAGEKRPKDVGRSNSVIIAEQQSVLLPLAEYEYRIGHTDK